MGEQSTGLLGWFWGAPTLGVSRQSLELFVWVEGLRGTPGDLLCKSQTQASSSAVASPSTGLATAH